MSRVRGAGQAESIYSSFVISAYDLSDDIFHFVDLDDNSMIMCTLFALVLVRTQTCGFDV